MQSWVIILNIDDLNGSVDGQIIVDIKSEIVFLMWSREVRSGGDGKTGNQSQTITRADVTIFYI